MSTDGSSFTRHTEGGRVTLTRLKREGRPNSWSMSLEGIRNSVIDLDDPEYSDEHFQRVPRAFVRGALDNLPTMRVLHIGGALYGTPRAMADRLPKSSHLVMEPNSEMVEMVEEVLGEIPAHMDIAILQEFGEEGIKWLPDGKLDAIMVDAYDGERNVPAIFTEAEFLKDAHDCLDIVGVMVMHVVDERDQERLRGCMEQADAIFDSTMVLGNSKAFSTKEGRRPMTFLIASKGFKLDRDQANMWVKRDSTYRVVVDGYQNWPV